MEYLNPLIIVSKSKQNKIFCTEPQRIYVHTYTDTNTHLKNNISTAFRGGKEKRCRGQLSP